jgi:hypothetical protein
MNEQEQYALAIAEGTFNGSFEEFIASNVNGGGDNAGSGNAGGGNDGGGNSTQATTDTAAAAKARAEMDSDAKAKKAAESTKGGTPTGGTPTGGLLSIGKKNIEPLSKSAQLAQWNAKYAKFSADDLQKEQNRLSQLGDTGGELLNFVNGVLNKIQTEQAAAQEAKFKALDAKRKAAAAQALLETQDNAELRRKRLADEAKSAEENAKIIAAELLIKKAEEDKAALELIKAAEEKAKQDAADEEAKRKAAELAGLTEAQRIRNRRIKALLSKGIVVRSGYTLKSFAERMEFLDNERIRRNTEDERRIAIDILIADEPQTKLEFDEYITNLQLEFDLLMQSKYPSFTRTPTTTPKEKEDLKISIDVEQKRIKALQLSRRAKNRKRREDELARKAAERALKYAELRDEEQQDIFEDTVNDDMIEESEENLDLNNMTDIERARKEINDLERKLGREVVPHRDIIESTDSDFDIDSQLNPTDILIRDTAETDTGLTEERQLELLELKESMDSDEVEGLYITKKIAESKMRAAIDAVETQLINLNNNNIQNNNR